MSLQVWLPLNGNLNNQGCSPLKPVQMSVIPTYVNGKIGQALSTGDFYLPAAEVTKFYNNDEMSFCFWLYPIGTSGGNGIIGQQGMSIGDNRMFTIFQYPTPLDLHLSWQNNDSSSTFFVSIDSGFFTADTWNHCAIVYNGSTVKIYKNGNLYTTYDTPKSTRSSFNYDVPIPSSTIRYLNDLRIYDHALSPKEVKEISKALVVHYPLDNVMESGLRNLYPSIPYTPYNDEGYYKWVVDYTGAGSHSWPSFSFGAIDTTGLFNGNNPTTLLFYIKYRVNNAENMGIYIRCARDNNDWTCPSADWVTYTDGKWHECVQIVNMYATSQLPYNESPTPTSPRIECGFQDLYDSGVHYYIDVDIKDVMICPIDHYIPYINNNMISNKIIDTSGFGYHGNRNGTFNISSDTPRYSVCTDFNNDGHIKNDSFGLITSAFTLNLWVNPKAMNNQHFIFGTFDSWTNNGIGVWRDTNIPDRYTCLIKSDSVNTYNSIVIYLTLNVWNMITLIYDGTTFIGYVNGVEQNRITYGSNGTITNPNFMIANSKYNGTPASENEQAYISDFRLYATALSADDIKELYKTSASISDNGTMFGYDFNEE